MPCVRQQNGGMNGERVQGTAGGRPFPIYPNLVDDLVTAHRTNDAERDPRVAHVLGTCAGYAYSDSETMATMAARLGLDGNACVCVSQTVDAMFIYSTAYVIQSRCGRVVLVCYRGTEPTTFGNWIGDADVGSDSIVFHAGGQTILTPVHSGFHRNVRATRWSVLRELHRALSGRSLLDPNVQVANRMEALYVTGHSLGGAMAVLFALSLSGTPEHAALWERLRAVYTYGQPMAVADAGSPALEAVSSRVFRHVTLRDIIPSLPPVAWGRFAHIGEEYVYVDEQWRRSETPVAQLANFREIPRSLLAFFATGKRRRELRYTVAEHGPHHYLSALRPPGLVTEFGDEG